MGLGFFGAADKNLAKSDDGMGAGEISVQRQCMFTFGDAPYGALVEDLDIAYGDANILGKPYVTGYEPIRDAQNNVIGIYFVGYAK
jgi:hypothetical protein